MRVSTGKQDEAAQVPDLLRYAEARCYKVDDQRYVLHDKSAFKGGQEGAQRQALADMRAGAYDVLLVWASDRLERRGIRQTLGLLDEFAIAGGRVECPAEPWMSSPASEGTSRPPK